MLFRNNYSYLNLLPYQTYSSLSSKKKIQDLAFTSFSFSNSRFFFSRFKAIKNSFSDKSKFVKFLPCSTRLLINQSSNNFFFFYNKSISSEFFRFFLNHQLLLAQINCFYTLPSRFNRGSFLNNQFTSFQFLNEFVYLRFYKTSSISFIKNNIIFSKSDVFFIKDPLINLLRIKFSYFFYSFSLKIMFKHSLCQP
jgi:hypothetical protein